MNVLERGGSTFRHYKHDPGDANSISDDLTTGIFEDSYHNIWIGTFAGG